MRNHILTAAAVAMALAAPASADLTGEAAPEINPKEWIGKAPGQTLKSLRGKAVILEFFATW